MPSTLAVVLSYHPALSLLENVKALLLQVSHVLIVDNESSAQSKEIFLKLPTSGVSYIFNDDNRGVAEGFNQGIRWGLEKEYNYFLLMDQDSFPQAKMLEKLLEVQADKATKKTPLLVGPHHEDFERKMGAVGSMPVERVPLLITSGSLLSRELIEEVGLYDERLFIDHVDHDYCLRITKKGGLCLKVNSAVLLHKFGEARVKSFLGKSFFLQEYSSFRRYHMMRNRIVLYKRYGMFKGDWFWLDMKIAIKDLIKLTLFEKERRAKLTAVLKGFVDGLLWSDSK
ncbi:MAG: glycosyltransferase family 2 protein [Pseudobdellovibrionaceae bacterium]